MNSKQKIVIATSIVLLLFCAIIVPYEGTETTKQSIHGRKQEGDVLFGPITGYDISKNRLFLGYYPIFSPPTKEDMEKAFSHSSFILIEYSYETNINLMRWIIQIFILLIISTGLFFLFADSKQKHGAPK